MRDGAYIIFWTLARWFVVLGAGLTLRMLEYESGSAEESVLRVTMTVAVLCAALCKIGEYRLERR